MGEISSIFKRHLTAPAFRHLVFSKTYSFRKQENSPSYQAPLRVAKSGRRPEGSGYILLRMVTFAGAKSSNQQQSHFGFISIIIITIINIIIIIITYYLFTLLLPPGTQREYSSKALKHSIVKRILVFKR